MRNIVDFIRKYKKSLIVLYVLSFVVVIMIMLNNQNHGNLFLFFVDWIWDNTIIVHYRYVEYYPCGSILSSCFGSSALVNSGISGGLNVPEISVINNHYIQSSIALPSIFIACCWVILSYVSSFLKRVTS